MIACTNNSLKLIELLLERYPDIINQKDNKGWTGFMIACEYNSLEVIELLLTKYPDIINQKNIYERTGYDYMNEECKRFITDYI